MKTEESQSYQSESQSGRSGQSWVEPFVRVVSDFADTAPLLGEKASTYSELRFCADRLRGIVTTLTEAPLEGELSTENEQLVGQGIDRLKTILVSLKAQSLTTSGEQFIDFDELALAERVQALPPEDYVNLYRQVISDPQKISNFEAVTRAAILKEYGLPLLMLSSPTVILFKLIVLLILFLIVMSFPVLIPFALAVVAALVDLDRAGASEEDGDDPRDTPPPTIFGEELDEQLPDCQVKVSLVQVRLSRRVRTVHQWRLTSWVQEQDGTWNLHQYVFPVFSGNQLRWTASGNDALPFYVNPSRGLCGDRVRIPIRAEILGTVQDTSPTPLPSLTGRKEQTASSVCTPQGDSDLLEIMVRAVRETPVDNFVNVFCTYKVEWKCDD